MSCSDRCAVITGASQGLGKAFAEACARRGYDLLLSSLPGEGLPGLGAALAERWGVAARCLELDLASEAGRETLVAAARDWGRPVGLLVNNAGIAQNGLFDRLPLAAQLGAVDLNIGAPIAITWGLIPLLQQCPGSKVITVASLAAWQPMPLFAVYAASKAFLLHWGVALRHELAPLGVGSMVLAPGGVLTSTEIREKTRSQGLVGRLSSMEPEDVAEAALDAAERGMAIVIPGLFNRLVAGLTNFLPRDLKAASVMRRWMRALGKLRGSPEAAYYARDGRAA